MDRTLSSSKFLKEDTLSTTTKIEDQLLFTIVEVFDQAHLASLEKSRRKTDPNKLGLTRAT
jgi:hypothetical protein